MSSDKSGKKKRRVGVGDKSPFINFVGYGGPNWWPPSPIKEAVALSLVAFTVAAIILMFRIETRLDELLPVIAPICN